MTTCVKVRVEKPVKRKTKTKTRLEYYKREKVKTKLPSPIVSYLKIKINECMDFGHAYDYAWDGIVNIIQTETDERVAEAKAVTLMKTCRKEFL